MRRLIALTVFASAAVLMTLTAAARQNPFLGVWNINGTGEDAANVYWLEVKETEGRLTGRFLDRVASPFNLGIVKIESGELIFQRGTPERPTGSEYRAKIEGDKLVGRHIMRSGGRGGAAPTERTVNWVGVRPPAWPAADANAQHRYGTPVALFDGTSLDAFGVQNATRPMNWSIVDGVLGNLPPANNLVSKQKFGDFKMEAEYRLAAESNSGLYIRGRYELQLFDDFGKPPTITGHMSIYGRTPASVNASKPAGEWQQMSAIVVANRITVTLNGQRVHDNAIIEGVTGGTLDNAELTPGPILIQGDHKIVEIKRLVVTPILR